MLPPSGSWASTTSRRTASAVKGATTVRRLLRLDAVRDADLLQLTVQADAFCHSMVRALVGALIAVGEGRRPVSWPATSCAARHRDPGGRVVPAHGLTLVEVTYPADAELAARAEATRRGRASGSAPAAGTGGMLRPDGMAGSAVRPPGCRQRAPAPEIRGDRPTPLPNTVDAMGHIDVAHVRHTLPDGRLLFDDVSFRVGDGARAALIGDNGAGKSTLLRLLAGELTPEAGLRRRLRRPRGDAAVHRQRPRRLDRA